MKEVRIWEEQIIIPTYEIGQPEKNPVFLEKRVYQGSTGKTYPYPTIEHINDEKVDKEYKAVTIENEYIRVMILPELGGRIQRAYDKTNGYDFVYYNHVIKPALVGLLGPWIAGGIEFNWPQHHRPTTYLPVDYLIRSNEDGSKSLLVNDVDQMYGTKGIAVFTLYPGKAYIEIKGQLYNRTAMPQTFLWWANPAVAVNDHTQSIFPPDVQAVMDHGKRDVSGFPIATGVYYKHDYSAGVDISRYKNIPVPTSYMAAKSDYDFMGGYDHKLRSGILHVADHHISPGKKQWTWGNGDFGEVWYRNLTDADGPYVELMTGVYTDNQPDFSWLMPFEEKTFKQYFMPYKAVGEVKNATVDAAVNLMMTADGIYLCVYATSEFERAVIRLTNREQVVVNEVVDLSPQSVYEKTFKAEVERVEDLRADVFADDKLLVSYQPQLEKKDELPHPAQAAKDPEFIKTNEELYLTGLHLEQYRHATYLPDPYYLEGLKRDAGDVRINNAYGRLLLQRGCFAEAEDYFRKALERLLLKNPNPYDSEPYFNLGLALFYQEKTETSYDVFYKAAWSNDRQEMSFYYLAAIAASRHDYEMALEFIDKGLLKNVHNIKSRGLKSYILRKLCRIEETRLWCEENLKIDAFDYLSMFEMSLSEADSDMDIVTEMNTRMRGFAESYLQVARDYAEFGAYEEAVKILRQCKQQQPMLYYYEAFYLHKSGRDDAEVLRKADNACPDYCFPNKLEDIAVLNHAINRNPAGAKAYYYLGNLYYDKRQYQLATKLWEDSIRQDDKFSIVLRNLSLAYYNKRQLPEIAKNVMEMAFALDTDDSRIFMELDQLYKKTAVAPWERLQKYEKYRETFTKRDDSFIEYITLHNMLEQYEKAYELIMSRKFHAWEGGEGKITMQYTIALVEMAKKAISNEDYSEAERYLKLALTYPENLGEGKLEGTKDNHIYYYLGIIMERTGCPDQAKEYFERAALGVMEPAGSMYYNDQPADMILYQGLAKQKLGETEAARARFRNMIEYGEKHLMDNVRIDYFAVSLPDLLIFDEDLKTRNQAHCYYLIGLGNMGFGDFVKVSESFEKALSLDKNHMNCLRYKRDILNRDYSNFYK